uniref:Uncharacterized protein n=1 Tax=uncultured organism TaxID=155900 RepID=M1QAU8_9ZZZZ|nr:hypothetical protein FLSS-17_0006 [uncultured organism]
MEDSGVWYVKIPGRPVPKTYSRKGSTMFKSRGVKQKEKEIGYRFRSKHGKLLLQADLFFSLLVNVPDRRHGDLKNYIYLAEDALSRIAYEDDRQIKKYVAPQVNVNKDEQFTLITLGFLGEGFEKTILEERYKFL